MSYKEARGIHAAIRRIVGREAEVEVRTTKRHGMQASVGSGVRVSKDQRVRLAAVGENRECGIRLHGKEYPYGGRIRSQAEEQQHGRRKRR